MCVASVMVVMYIHAQTAVRVKSIDIIATGLQV